MFYDCVFPHFYMVRHGQSQANAEGWFSGQIDTPLTDLGREQAACARDLVKSVCSEAGVIISSRLSRAADTAKIINGALNLPHDYIEDLAEIDFGTWTRQPHSDEAIKAKYTAMENPPGGESWAGFDARVQRGVSAALKLAHTRIPVLVCHGGVIKSMGRTLKRPISHVENCAVYQITRGGDITVIS